MEKVRRQVFKTLPAVYVAAPTSGEAIAYFTKGQVSPSLPASVFVVVSSITIFLWYRATNQLHRAILASSRAALIAAYAVALTAGLAVLEARGVIPPAPRPVARRIRAHRPRHRDGMRGPLVGFRRLLDHRIRGARVEPDAQSVLQGRRRRLGLLGAFAGKAGRCRGSRTSRTTDVQDHQGRLYYDGRAWHTRFVVELPLEQTRVTQEAA